MKQIEAEGRLSLQAFAALVAQWKDDSPRKKLERIFDMIDKENKGYLTQPDLIEAFRVADSEANDVELMDMGCGLLTHASVDGTELHKADFVTWMLSQPALDLEALLHFKITE